MPSASCYQLLLNSLIFLILCSLVSCQADVGDVSRLNEDHGEAATLYHMVKREHQDGNFAGEPSEVSCQNDIYLAVLTSVLYIYIYIYILEYYIKLIVECFSKSKFDVISTHISL